MQQIAAKEYNTKKNTNKDLATIQLQQAIEQLSNLSTDELVNLYIDYASQNSYETIYSLDESTINELYTSPWQALYDSNHKEFNDRDYFFTYNGNGHMVSFSNEDDSNCPITFSELAQWLIDEDKLSEYDITVTTIDDMLASIGDNIADDEILLNTVCQYLHLNHITLGNEYSFYEKVNIVMELIDGFNYEQLCKLIADLSINYQ